uniref:Uncharacterized protein n=1 Tax=Lepeophtheirus salmonis TaxID=72036 RepID=A0A0K2VCJ5_LEPSM
MFNSCSFFISISIMCIISNQLMLFMSMPIFQIIDIEFFNCICISA